MQTCQLTYHLLEKFEFATPGVDPSQLEARGYLNEEVAEKFEFLRSSGLTNVIVARDKLGRPYTGMIIELTQAGSNLLEKERRCRLQKAQAIQSDICP
jgi:hypothetical protein